MTPEAALAAAIEQVEVYGDVPAADLLEALRTAGWVLTPLAPEVPPRAPKPDGWHTYHICSGLLREITWSGPDAMCPHCGAPALPPWKAASR